MNPSEEKTELRTVVRRTEELDHQYDCEMMLKALESRGFTASIADIHYAWGRYSEDHHSAGWLAPYADVDALLSGLSYYPHFTMTDLNTLKAEFDQILHRPKGSDIHQTAQDYQVLCERLIELAEKNAGDIANLLVKLEGTTNEALKLQELLAEWKESTRYYKVVHEQALIVIDELHLFYSTPLSRDFRPPRRA